MLRGRIRNVVNFLDMITERSAENFIGINRHFCGWYSAGSCHVELPIKRKKSERKPLVTSVNELKREASLRRKEKQMVQENPLRPPKNGLLVKGLVLVAHEVYAARAKLNACVSRIVKSIAIFSCR
ncbi:hypothetical protein ACJW31_03G007100 [Castanea mollissima]